MDIGARPKQLNLLSFDDTSDEMERPSPPAHRSRLPASTMDREDNIDDLMILLMQHPLVKSICGLKGVWTLVEMIDLERQSETRELR